MCIHILAEPYCYCTLSVAVRMQGNHKAITILDESAMQMRTVAECHLSSKCCILFFFLQSVHFLSLHVCVWISFCTLIFSNLSSVVFPPSCVNVFHFSCYLALFFQCFSNVLFLPLYVPSPPLNLSPISFFHSTSFPICFSFCHYFSNSDFPLPLSFSSLKFLLFYHFVQLFLYYFFKFSLFSQPLCLFQHFPPVFPYFSFIIFVDLHVHVPTEFLTTCKEYLNPFQTIPFTWVGSTVQVISNASGYMYLVRI